VLLPRPLTLKPKGRKPPELGPLVRVENVRITPAAENGPPPAALIRQTGLADWDRDSLKEQGTLPKTMWLGVSSPDLKIEFDLPDAVPVGVLEVWNYNADWETGSGIRKADIAVSTDGSTWQTVLRGAEFAEAEGRDDYDNPVVLNLNTPTARKIRFENISTWDNKEKVGLSKIRVHEAAGQHAVILTPEDGASGLSARSVALKWAPAPGTKEHKVYLGTDAASLKLVGTTKDNHLEPQDLKPGADYFWRVDEVPSTGPVMAGRVCKFTAAGLVAWVKLDDKSSDSVADSSGAHHDGKIIGRPKWQPGPNGIGTALEFDGHGTHIDLGADPVFDLPDAVSVAVWIKVREFDKSKQAIISKGDTGWRLRRKNETDQLTFDCNGPTAKATADSVIGVSSRRPVNDGKWHHVVALYDGTRLAFHLDGELQNTTMASGPIAVNTGPLLIGQERHRLDRSWNGWMSDLRVYGYALTAEEIQTLFHAADTQRAAK
jgi:hypothetical protein